MAKDMSCSEVRDLIDAYCEKGGCVYLEIEEGGLGYGTTILTNEYSDEPLPCYVIEEYYVSAWASMHKVKRYKDKLPKKYEKLLEDYHDRIAAEEEEQYQNELKRRTKALININKEMIIDYCQKGEVQC